VTARQWTALRAALVEARARRWHKRAGVVGLGIGQRHRQGRWQERTACLVVKVAWKRDPARLGRSALPSWIDVRVAGTRTRVRVDVQETRGELLGTCEGLVGESVSYDGQSQGAVSAVVTTQDAVRVVLIAGHVAPGSHRDIEIGGLAGVTRAPVMTTRLDHCLVDSTEPLPDDAGLLPGGHLVTGVVAVQELGLDQTLYVHHADNPMRLPVVLHGVEMSVPFRYPSGVRVLSGLLATDGVTARGDSGALLYDSAFRAAGTLVGTLGGASYFIPCERAAAMLAITFQ
jgi:hypothetical protein